MVVVNTYRYRLRAMVNIPQVASVLPKQTLQVLSQYKKAQMAVLGQRLALATWAAIRHPFTKPKRAHAITLKQ